MVNIFKVHLLSLKFQPFTTRRDYFGLNHRRVKMASMTSVRYLVSCLAIAIFFALFAMPGTALAHGGHSHATPVTIDAGNVSAPEPIVVSDTKQHAKVFVASKPAPSDDRGCVGGCCGSMTGMACCSVALTPAPVEEPALLRSSIFVIVDYRPPHGLSLEALPKPPKSLA